MHINGYGYAPSGSKTRRGSTRDFTLAYKDLSLERPSEISCTASPCLTPGGSVTVTVYVHVDVPYMDKGLTVQARETMPVDELRAPRTP